MGDVIGDLNSRRGLVQEFTDKPGGMKVGGWVEQLADGSGFDCSSLCPGWVGGVPSYRSAGGCSRLCPDLHAPAGLTWCSSVLLPCPCVAGGQGQRAPV